jgi:acyl-CoA synthetase (AMP-forming)/AMP-acid ligase II
MPSELDRQLDAVLAAQSAPGGPLETARVPVERFGVDLPMVLRAPPALPQLFAAFCKRHGPATFLVDGDLRLSFAETYAAARMAAGGLVAGHRLRRGEFVGLAARNSANWIVAYMAILMAGGCATLLNGWWQGRELAEGIRHGPCRLVLADGPRADRLAAQPHGAQILRIEHDCPPEIGLAALTEAGGGVDTPLPECAGEDRATLLFTSGSTGLPKGVLSDHRGKVQAAMSYVAQTLPLLGVLQQRGMAPAGQPATLINLPLFHITGEVPVMLQSFILGRKLVVMSKWDAIRAMHLIEQERVTYFVGVPLMSQEIATHPERGRFDLSSCLAFAAGGAPRPVEHVTQIRQAIPTGFLALGYGLTETNAVGCSNVGENYLAKPASTGRATRPLVEVAILDSAGGQMPPGATGEIGIRSICNMTGYWRDEEATAAAFTADGFFRSGDLGRLDDDGYLFILDRQKDIIIRGGENISSVEVEHALYAHPAVAEAAVFGLPDQRLGEVPVAIYVAKPGKQLVEDELAAFVAERLAPFKRPVRLWRSAEALPRLGTEKVDKRCLRERFAAEWQQAPRP